MKNPAPYRYDIVGSFLRTAAIHEARARFESGAISAKELAQVEDAEIRTLVQKEETVGYPHMLSTYAYSYLPAAICGKLSASQSLTGSRLWKFFLPTFSFRKWRLSATPTC